MHFSDERSAELRELFFESAQEILQVLNDEALKLEHQPGDAEVVRSIRRAVHTLKGDSAACGFRELSESAHEFEDALALETLPSDASLAELAFTAADTFDAMLSAYRQNVPAPSAKPLRNMIAALIATPRESSQEKKKPATEWTTTEAEQLTISNALGHGQFVYHVTVQIDPNCAMPIAARQLILNALQSVGVVLAERERTSANGRVQLFVATHLSSDQVAAKCRIPTVVSSAKVDQIEAVEMAADKGHVRQEATGESGDVAIAIHPHDEPEKQTTSGGVENILRVDAERIDSVLNLVGELIIGKSMLQQSMQEFARRFPKDPLRGRFADAMGFQARVLNDLQRSVMKIRMVPVEQLFRRFPRMVRDVAKQCGKQVDLVLTGQETDLDKSLLDSISEPLTHLVRNAIGHGLEAADDRFKAGKPPRGTLRLNASHQGNQVVVEVRDDGRGIDVQKVKANAIRKGIVTAEEASRLADQETLDLIFRPGFSTAEQITEVSGRGVGLDVVQAVLHRLKGTVEIETQPGQGTTFRLKLPLTLAIIKALLFRVEHRLYAVPLNSVAEITRAKESDLHQVNHYEVLQLRNQALSVIRLGRPPADPSQRSAKVFVLVMSAGDRKLGLIVDALEGEEELVIKALDDHTVATDLVSGASILGDGRVVLILNLAAIVERSFTTPAEKPGQVGFGMLLSQVDKAKLALHATGGQS
jgi:two-component system chemotaxis sensor kinase CheA